MLGQRNPAVHEALPKLAGGTARALNYHLGYNLLPPLLTGLVWCARAASELAHGSELIAAMVGWANWLLSVAWVELGTYVVGLVAPELKLRAYVL